MFHLGATRPDGLHYQPMYFSIRMCLCRACLPRLHFKTGLTYRPREAVFFPYWIAETGQRLMQPQHLRHLLFVQVGWELSYKVNTLHPLRTQKKKPRHQPFPADSGVKNKLRIPAKPSFLDISDEVVDDLDFLFLDAIDKLRLPDLDALNQGGDNFRSQFMHLGELPNYPNKLLRVI